MRLGEMLTEAVRCPHAGAAVQGERLEERTQRAAGLTTCRAT